MVVDEELKKKNETIHRELSTRRSLGWYGKRACPLSFESRRRSCCFCPRLFSPPLVVVTCERDPLLWYALLPLSPQKSSPKLGAGSGAFWVSSCLPPLEPKMVRHPLSCSKRETESHVISNGDSAGQAKTPDRTGSEYEGKEGDLS